MKQYHRIGLLLALLSLQSCGLVNRLTEFADDGRQLLVTMKTEAAGAKEGWDTFKADAGERYEKLKGQFDGVTAKLGTLAESAKAKVAEHKAKADTDGDGKTSPSEWAAYLLALLTGGGGLLAEGRRRVGIRNAESDNRKSLAEARIDALEAAAKAT